MVRSFVVVPFTATLLACLIGSGSIAFAPLTSVRAGSSQDAPPGEACRECHTSEVDGYRQTRMAHSMRLASHEPSGVVRASEATIRVDSDKDGS